MGAAKELGTAPSTHECLEPPDACNLLIDDEEKGSWFGHHCEGWASVLAACSERQSNVAGRFQRGFRLGVWRQNHNTNCL